MMLFNYQIEVSELGDPSLLRGSFELKPGVKRVVCNLPKGTTLRAVEATAPLRLQLLMACR